MEKDNLPILNTKRLLLRKLEASDVEEIFFLRSDASVLKYIKRGPLKSTDEAMALIDDFNKRIDYNTLFYWGITMLGNSKLVGVICLWNFSADRKKAELGYELHPAHQKKGIMNEALQSVLEFAFETQEFMKIEAFTHKENRGSIKMLEKNNFQHILDLKDEGNINNIIFTLYKKDILASNTKI